MIDLKTIISDNISKVSLLIFTIFYLIITVFLVSENSSLVLIFYVFGSLFLYLFKPSISFIFTLLALIEPIGRISYGKIAILFVFLSFLHLFLNFRKYFYLVKEDKIFRLILINILVFMFYQLFITFIETDGTSYFNYFLINVRLILGVWVILPAYYFALTDRKNLLLSILLLSFITFIYFYISKVGIYDFFSISQSDRGMDKDITRDNVGMDFRYIIKIFAYFLPSIFFYGISKGVTNKLLFFSGLMAYGLMVVTLLRLDLIYTSIGGLLVVLLLKKNYEIINLKKKIGYIFLILVLLIVLFFNQLVQVVDTYMLTASSLSGSSSDSSLDTRMEWIPLLWPYFKEYIFIGTGFFALSFDNLDVYASSDMPLFASLAIYGIVGITIYLRRYFYLFKIFKRINISKELFEEYRLEVIILYGLGVFFIISLSFKLYLIFQELIYGWAYIEYAVLMGVFCGLSRFFEIKSEQLNEGIDEN